MVGTSDEVLEWLTHHVYYAPLMQMSRQRLVGLRHKLHEGTVSEQRKDELLERLNNRINFLKRTSMSSVDCEQYHIRKVRGRYVLPAVVMDRKGRIYNELTMIKIMKHREELQDLNIHMVYRAVKRGDFPTIEVRNEVLRRLGWKVVEERMVLPSVWEVGESYS